MPSGILHRSELWDRSLELLKKRPSIIRAAIIHSYNFMRDPL